MVLMDDSSHAVAATDIHKSCQR